MSCCRINQLTRKMTTVRDKYKSELKKTKADIDTGNQSGKSGELSQKYQLVQHILTEMDSEEEERKEKKKDKEVLNTIEGQLQSMKCAIMFLGSSPNSIFRPIASANNAKIPPL